MKTCIGFVLPVALCGVSHAALAQSAPQADESSNSGVSDIIVTAQDHRQSQHASNPDPHRDIAAQNPIGVAIASLLTLAATNHKWALWESRTSVSITALGYEPPDLGNGRYGCMIG